MAKRCTTKGMKTKPAARARPRRVLRRRISGKYRVILPRIAEIYVAAARNAQATARVVQSQLGMPSFKPHYIGKWLNVAEFAALVREEEERQAALRVVSPFARGPKKIAWLHRIETIMQEAYDADEGTQSRDELSSKVSKVADQIREEQKVLADLTEKKARRQFGRFVKNLLSLARREGEALLVLKFLRRAMDRVDSLMGEMPDVEFDAGSPAGAD